MSPEAANLGILPPQRSRTPGSIRKQGFFYESLLDSQGFQVSFLHLRIGISQAFPEVLRGVEFFGQAQIAEPDQTR